MRQQRWEESIHCTWKKRKFKPQNNSNISTLSVTPSRAICKTFDPFFHINIQNPQHHPTYQVGPLFNGDGAHLDFSRDFDEWIRPWMVQHECTSFQTLLSLYKIGLLIYDWDLVLLMEENIGNHGYIGISILRIYRIYRRYIGGYSGKKYQ